MPKPLKCDLNPGGHPRCNQKLENVQSHCKFWPLWDVNGKCTFRNPDAYIDAFELEFPQFSSKPPYGNPHVTAIENPNKPFYGSTCKGAIVATLRTVAEGRLKKNKRRSPYSGDKTSVEDIKAWVGVKEWTGVAAELIVHGKFDYRKKIYTHITDQQTYDKNLKKAEEDAMFVAQSPESSETDGAGYDPPAADDAQQQSPASSDTDDAGQPVPFAGVQRVRGDAKAVAAAAERSGADCGDNPLGNCETRTWPVGACVRTNIEQTECTSKLLKFLRSRRVRETHVLHMEYKLYYDDGDGFTKFEKTDVSLLAKDRTKHCDIHFECKVKDCAKALGQCLHYQCLAERAREGAEVNVYAYFPEELKGFKFDQFKKYGIGVLWPGNEEIIQFERRADTKKRKR